MKRLFRKPDQGKISGICAGVADYMQVDVTVVRLVAMTVIVLSGVVPGVLAYFIATLITPVEGKE